MANPPMDVARLAVRDTAQAARLLSDVRAARLTGQRPRLAPRPVIDQSWDRMLRSGVDPDHGVRAGLLTSDELERRRAASRLRHVLPVLRQGLLSVADATQHIVVVADADGRVLWREGSTAVLRRADSYGFEPGADWAEDVVGTNGVGTPMVARRPVQVFASEHFVRSLATWTCTGAPITDPRDGRLLGVVDVSGPLETMHPATLAWVDSVAKLAEARLRERHHQSLERLRSAAAPVLARLGGRALAVDRDGWTAAVTGMPYTNRVALPKSLSPGRRWLPALGLCAVEPLAGGWLIRAAEPEARGASRIVLDLGRARRSSVALSGPAGSWTHELSPRHAELLYLLALHPAGRSAAGLADDVFGDPARTVTVRAEMSRIRRYLGAFLEHRPYRFSEDTEVDVLLPDDPRDLLPHSTAPAVARGRAAEKAAGVRTAPDNAP
ncbi:GAF domain-containing protein [Streptomyces sp. WI04-05B]|uniref:GAF domain-containing protein n=1 Tax=Streptomyces TaxID=1883 RepID=UPI0029B146B1|nr:MULTISPECIES: GAF domain-containing protein [unclassified Streptomyces]MDX2546672.1 GAF domain-containing protein [Streptomyces sp. WI04-05B]MDX2587697.1 GAF domain-containing protein [Streptomyces sp. WI04-05A]MDX3751705.1 GAF domain-containing protein [Streptomyces sp. AK08-02]